MYVRQTPAVNAYTIGTNQPFIVLTTGLVDLRTRAWDKELLDVLDLDEERLPHISDEPADGWFPAALDGACSNLGAGCVTRERAALMVGTSGALRIVHETEQPEPREGLFLHWLDGDRVVEGGSLSDGGNLSDPSSTRGLSTRRRS